MPRWIWKYEHKVQWASNGIHLYIAGVCKIMMDECEYVSDFKRNVESMKLERKSKIFIQTITNICVAALRGGETPLVDENLFKSGG